MAAFEYLALDPSGRQQKGVLEADSARQVRQLLRERQLAPLDVKPTRTREQSGQGGRLTFARGLSARDLALVTRQLATLVQAALPIEEALRAAAAQSTSQRIQSMLLAVRAKVLEGHSLAGSLREFPTAFPELYRATVAAGEHAGHLGPTLAILTRSGVPLVEALAIAAEVIANRIIRNEVVKAAQKVREGASLTRSLEATGQFPPMMLHMIASGERSGELDQMLARTARNQENDLAAQIGLMVGLFEPFMLIFMGAVVLVIVLAILLPILSLNQLVG